MSKKPVGHKARKRFGQNFLHDQGVIRRIIRSIAPQEDQHLVEIGPGLGAITEELLPECKQLNVVELDRDLIPILRTKFFGYADKFSIHEADALKFDFASLYQAPQQLRVVGNLPYNISTPLIFHLLTYAEQIEDMHFMLQKEVVDRLAAKPGDSAYGRLGIMAQYYCHIEPLFIVPPESFDPAPKVDSAIVRLVPYKKVPHPVQDIDKLEVVVRTAFGQRRKTLRNNLKPLISADDIQALDIDPGLRPERLSLQDFIRISDFISTKQSD